jgi:hypothetical protein
MIAALAPGGGGDAAAAQEVMDTIADPQTGSIDFSGFLHFFSMVSVVAKSVHWFKKALFGNQHIICMSVNHRVIPSCSGRAPNPFNSQTSSSEPATCMHIHSWRGCWRLSHRQQLLESAMRCLCCQHQAAPQIRAPLL